MLVEAKAVAFGTASHTATRVGGMPVLLDRGPSCRDQGPGQDRLVDLLP